MISIELAYFIIIIISWVYKIQEKKSLKELTLLIINRLFLLVTVIITSISFYDLFGMWGEVFQLSNSPITTVSFYITIAWTLFYFIVALLFLIPRIARNIWISSIIGIFLLYQDVIIFFPQYSIENIILSLIVPNYLPSSWTYFPPSYLQLFLENFIFFLIWFLFFYILKKKIKPINNITLEHHLIQD